MTYKGSVDLSVGLASADTVPQFRNSEVLLESVHKVSTTTIPRMM